MKTNQAISAAAAVLALFTLLPLPQAAGQAATPVTVVPPVLATPFYQGVPTNATIPRVVPALSSPVPQSDNANPNLNEVRITFDQPMDTALFFWPIPTNDPDFPMIVGDPFWTNGNRTVVLPVVLSEDRVYNIPINSPTVVFRGATGLYANPGLFRFATKKGGGSVPASALNNNNGRRNFGPAIPPQVATPIAGNTAVPNIGQQQGNNGAGSSANVPVTNTGFRTRSDRSSIPGIASTPGTNSNQGTGPTGRVTPTPRPARRY